MKRILLIAVVAVVVLTPLLLRTLPARLLPMVLPGNELQLSGLSGSLLKGRAARTLLITPAGPLHLGAVRWRFRPLRLLTFSPALSLRSTWAEQRFTADVTLSTSTLRIKDLDGRFSAALLRQFAPLALDGSIELLFDEISLDAQGPVEAEGRIVWQDAKWLSPSGPRLLGTYVAQLSSEGERQVQADVGTLAGPLRVEGTAQLANGNYRTNLRIDGDDAPIDPGVAQALALLAAPEDSGYRLTLEGALPAASP